LPALQAWPASQTAPAFAPVQSPLAPQCAALVLGSTQVPPQLTIPTWQATTQVPPTQVVPVPQTFPHEPQFALSVAVFAQYSAPPASPPVSPPPPQVVSPAPQPVAHVPSEQTMPASHALPHAPQFFPSSLVSMQASPQRVVPPRQSTTQAPA
jgi:hypothetical protein